MIEEGKFHFDMGFGNDILITLTLDYRFPQVNLYAFMYRGFS